MKKQVLCIGELLIDFICSDLDVDLKKGNTFIKKAGGAPANVAVTLSKLGTKAYFAGKVGEDAFGFFLEDTLKTAGVDTELLIKSAKYPTTLAFVSLDKHGERDFMFNRGADAHHLFREVNPSIFQASEIVHFGSATALLGGETTNTYLKLLDDSKNQEKFISFDPNYRVDLWRGRVDLFVEQVRSQLSGIDFLKVSEEELYLLTDDQEIDSAVKKLHTLGVAIIAVTLGKEGTYISNGSRAQTIESIKIKSIDSTGAGDAFVGGFLKKVSDLDTPKSLVHSFESLCNFTKYANTVGALVCTKLGAIDAIPSTNDVESII